MTQQDSPRPPEGNGPPNDRPPRNSDPGQKRPERKPSGNLFWYLLIALIVAGIGLSMFAKTKKGDEVRFSEFYAGLDPDGELQRQGKPVPYHKGNVHELTIGKEFIRFQDKKKPKDGEPAESDTPANHFYIPIVSIGDEEKKDLTRALRQKGIAYSYESPPPEWQRVMGLLLLPLLVLVLIIFFFRRLGGAGSAMSFGRSRGRLYANEDVQVTFNDVAGIEEAVNELREVVEFLRQPQKYQALGGRIPRGVLLVGPPGTGKTLLAKAVAGEAGVPFFGLSGSDFVEMFVGVGAARVRDMFHQAAQRAPAIIFIDELDALGKTRGSGMPGGHDEREQTLNALLVEMDGFSSDQNVIVMAATNRPETLDPALMRPGRFDRHVMVDRPDVKGREATLKVHAAKIKMDDKVNLQKVAKMTPGFVGADLANLVNEAALLAARNDKNRVTMVEFEEGIERVVAGLEKQTRVIADDERQRIAYHECGHALVACSLPHTDPVHKISIIPRGMGLGYTLHFPDDDRQLITKTELQNRICCLLGGIVAEDIIFEESSTGAQNDLQRASSIARRMVTEFGMSAKLGRVYYGETSHTSFLGHTGAPESLHSEDTIREIDLEVQSIIADASNTVYEVLTNRRAALDHMARELIEVEVMDSDHLKRILDQYKTTPQISPGTRNAPSAKPEPAAEDDKPDAPDVADGT